MTADPIAENMGPEWSAREGRLVSAPFSAMFHIEQW